MNVLPKILPLFFLILFGYVLQRVKYFEEIAFNRLQNFILKVTIPCMLFTAFVNMKLDKSHIWLSAGVFFYLVILLLLGLLLYRLLHIKNDFFIFFLTTFGFGTIGFPLFTNIFGMQNADYIALLGVGHEFFVAGVYLPAMEFYFGGARPNGRSIIKAFATPTMIMVALGIVICLSGLQPYINSHILGEGLFAAISKLGELTLALALVLVGYRLQLQDKAHLKISVGYASLRFLVTLALGLAFSHWYFGGLLQADALVHHAFFTLIFQHSSIMLLIFVGQYRPLEQQIIINNAFVLNMVAGIVLFFLYMLVIVAG